jgi:mRNA-degrading endonuclease RelE of RelBE toxin-antitoxin system
MPFTIKIEPSALEDLEALRVFDRRRIVQAIDEQLIHEPSVETRNRKPLVGAQTSFASGLTLWELRLGTFRVFYHVDKDVVSVRAIRTKLPHQTTEQIL